jgi:hypothetical protein
MLFPLIKTMEKEKSYQVQQMGSIYSNAERVVIWLGEATYQTDKIMFWLQHLEEKKRSIQYAAGDQEFSDSQWMDLWSESVQNLRKSQQDVLVDAYSCFSIEIGLRESGLYKKPLIRELPKSFAEENLFQQASSLVRHLYYILS